MEYFICLGFLGILIYGSYYDFKDFFIPDLCHLGIFCLTVFRLFTDDDFSIYQSLSGAFLFFGYLFLIRFLLEFFLKKETVGWGDLKLVFFVGSLVGPIYFLLFYMISVFFGLSLYSLYWGFYRFKGKILECIPFGPPLFLSGGFCLILSLFKMNSQIFRPFLFSFF